MKKLLSLFTGAPVRADYVDSADLFRVVCVGLIAWFHIWQQSWLNPNFTVAGHTVDIYPAVVTGYIFVDGMILLSGFLLMLGMLNGRVKDSRSFYRARAARILPSYYFFLILQLALFILPRGLYSDIETGLIDTLSHFTFTQNFFREAYVYTQFTAVLWTLAVEVQFYLVFPVLGRAFRRRPLVTWAAMTLAGFFARYYVHRYCADTQLFINQLPCMLDVYANGMLAATVWVRLSRTEPKWWRAWVSTVITCVCVWGVYRLAVRQHLFSDLAQIRQSQMDIRFALTALGAVLLVTAGRSIRLLRVLCSNRVTRFLSLISFNFYMWHHFMALRLKEWNVPPHVAEYPFMEGEQPWQTLYTLYCFLVPMVIAAVITLVIEKPCARLLKKGFALRRKVSASAAAAAVNAPPVNDGAERAGAPRGDEKETDA